MHFRLHEIAAFSCPKFQKSYVFLTLVLSYFILYNPHSWIYDQFWKTSRFYQWENLPQQCLKHSAPRSWVSPPVQLIHTNLWMTEGGPADDRLPNEWHLKERKQVHVLLSGSWHFSQHSSLYMGLPIQTAERTLIKVQWSIWSTWWSTWVVTVCSESIPPTCHPSPWKAGRPSEDFCCYEEAPRP